MAGPVSVWVLPAAVVLDLLLGDPRNLPHPVRLMGKAVSATEKKLRRGRLTERVSGTVLAGTMVLATLLIGRIIMASASWIGSGFQFVVETILIYYCLAARDLDTAGRKVLRALVSGGSQAAKQNLRWIVGRQVDNLSVQGILRATIETVAENLVDGFVAPLLYAAVGGAPLALTYKMINTMDSMVGYKTAAYARFGWAAARLDDLANWLPARLSAPVIAFAGHLLYRRGWPAMVTVFRESGHHSSPNAGIPEAAFAAVLGVKLGGPNYYHGEKVEKPYIGTCFGVAETGDITRACDLMFLSAICWLLVCMALAASLAQWM